jgi:hypothetical protein
VPTNANILLVRHAAKPDSGTGGRGGGASKRSADRHRKGTVRPRRMRRRGGIVGMGHLPDCLRAAVALPYAPSTGASGATSITET